ncbi:uncharacterized protein RBU57_014730 [Macrochelys suwanniensis]
MADAGTYTCSYGIQQCSREIPCKESNPLQVTVTDPLPQPTLNADPPLGVVREGGAVLLSCVVPGNAVHWRFHFYKDGVQIIPRDAGSEHNGVVYSTMETVGHLSNWSMLHIPQTTPKSAGEYACEYEEDVSGRWILSPRSEVVNVEVTDHLPPPRCSLDTLHLTKEAVALRHPVSGHEEMGISQSVEQTTDDIPNANEGAQVKQNIWQCKVRSMNLGMVENLGGATLSP